MERCSKYGNMLRIWKYAQDMEIRNMEICSEYGSKKYGNMPIKNIEICSNYGNMLKIWKYAQNME